VFPSNILPCTSPPYYNRLKVKLNKNIVLLI